MSRVSYKVATKSVPTPCPEAAAPLHSMGPTPEFAQCLLADSADVIFTHTPR